MPGLLHLRLLGGREFDMKMKRDRKARMRITGEILHAALKLPEDVEVLDFEVELRGAGLKDECIDIEGNRPPYVTCFWEWAAGSST